MQQMTKEQAIDILTKVSGVFKGTREEHITIQSALEKIKELEEVPKPKEG